MSYARVEAAPAPRWKTYLRLGRVSNLPTVWTDVLAGAALAGVVPGAAVALLLALAVSLFYTGGMFLNDAFDHEVDARERPERPIPAGEIGLGEVYLLGFGMLGAGWVLTALATSRSGGTAGALVSAGALAGAIVVYNLRHKGNPLGPALMGLCRALVYVTAALAVAPGLRGSVIGGAVVLLSYVIGLTYTAKQETLGKVRNLWPLLFLAAPLVYAAPGGGGFAPLVLSGVLLVWILVALSFLRRPRPNVPGAVTRLIAGIALVDALLIAHAGFPELAWLAALGLPLTLLFQRYVRGT